MGENCCRNQKQDNMTNGVANGVANGVFSGNQQNGVINGVSRQWWLIMMKDVKGVIIFDFWNA